MGDTGPDASGNAPSLLSPWEVLRRLDEHRARAYPVDRVGRAGPWGLTAWACGRRLLGLACPGSGAKPACVPAAVCCPGPRGCGLASSPPPLYFRKGLRRGPVSPRGPRGGERRESAAHRATARTRSGGGSPALAALDPPAGFRPSPRPQTEEIAKGGIGNAAKLVPRTRGPASPWLPLQRNEPSGGDNRPRF